ncbi:hypothetical protein [Pseudopedobacter sp.]|uniref:hypothetical protein n=1 Tax=Pseudopedobacter sp. TaxID=1936787 RepID=UPI0033417C48
MKAKLLYFLILFSAVTFSCSKKESPEIILLQGNFSSENTLNVYKTELYTNKGKITNETIIANYINRKSLTGVFLDSKIKTLYMSTHLTIEIDQQGNFSSTNFYRPYASGKMERLTNNEVLLISNDSTTRYFPPGNIGGGIFVNCPADYVLRYPPSIKCISMPLETGYSEVCKTKILIPIIIKNSESLAIPIYTISYSGNGIGDKERCVLQEQSNFIKEDFYKNLSEGDTVLVQKKEQLLKKM